MNATHTDVLYIVGGFLIGAIITGIFAMFRLLQLERQKARLTAEIESGHIALEHVKAAMGNQFKVTAQEALSQSHEEFLKLANEKLKQAQNDGQHDLDKRRNAIQHLITPIEKRLQELGGAVEQNKGMHQNLQNEIKQLSTETAKLVGALRDPAAQGKWGEYILERLLENSGLLKGVHYQTQAEMVNDGVRQRPDVIINLNDGFHIVVDAKAPVNTFAQRLSEDISSDDYNTITHNLAKQVRAHVQALSRKGYWENLDSPDFTVLFLPSEYLYSAALRADPSLVDYANDMNIVIASPTLLMSLLRVVGLSWRQVALAENAEEISALGKELYERIAAFSTHMGKVGQNLDRATDYYNKAVSSLESRVLVTARKFQDLKAAPQGKDIESLSPNDRLVRVLTAPETQDITDKPTNISAKAL